MKQISPFPLLAVIVLSCTNVEQKPHTGSWGDQDDGTYKNPILTQDK